MISSDKYLKSTYESILVFCVNYFYNFGFVANREISMHSQNDYSIISFFNFFNDFSPNSDTSIKKVKILESNEVVCTIFNGITLDKFYQLITCNETNFDYDINNHNGRNSWSALHAACSEGNLPVATLLLKAGAYPDIIRADEKTPLDDAIENGNLELVKLLIEHGALFSRTNASINWEAKKGQINSDLQVFLTGVFQAEKEKGLDVSRSSVFAQLKECFQNNEVAKATMILKNYKVDLRGFESANANQLKKCALNNQIEMVKLLAEYGDEIVINHDNKSTITLAKEKGLIEMVELLEDLKHKQVHQLKDAYYNMKLNSYPDEIILGSEMF